MYTVEKMTKEIGIRKALGASASGLTGMLVRRFLLLVIISNAIAWPISYFSGRAFIQWAWVYSSEISVSFFLIGGGISFLAALLSVIFQTLKAAWSNPVDTFRYE